MEMCCRLLLLAGSQGKRLLQVSTHVSQGISCAMSTCLRPGHVNVHLSQLRHMWVQPVMAWQQLADGSLSMY